MRGRASPVSQAGGRFLRDARARPTSVGEPPIANTDLSRRSTLTDGSPDSIFATRECLEPTNSATRLCDTLRRIRRACSSGLGPVGPVRVQQSARSRGHLAVRCSGLHVRRNSEAMNPEARCRTGRPCLEGSESRNRLSGGTHLAGLLLGLVRPARTRRRCSLQVFSSARTRFADCSVGAEWRKCIELGMTVSAASLPLRCFRPTPSRSPPRSSDSSVRRGLRRH